MIGRLIALLNRKNFAKAQNFKKSDLCWKIIMSISLAYSIKPILSRSSTTTSIWLEEVEPGGETSEID